MKVQKCTQFQKLTVMITASERNKAKAIAKSRGMTFSGWLGQLVKSQIYDASSGVPLPDGIQGTFSPEKDFANR